MATKKASVSKKAAQKKVTVATKRLQKLKDDVKDLGIELGRVSKDVQVLAKQGKAKFNKLDEQTKKKAVAALGALAALLAMRQVKKKVKQKKK